jgi:phosphoglycerate dehydrogenase-like enzyme
MRTILIGLSEDEVSEAERAEIAAIAPGARVVVTNQPAEIEAILPEVEIIAGSVSARLLPLAIQLRWYQQWGAGADWLARRPELAERDFVLTNVSGVHAIPISEHILALMLAFARALPAAFRGQARGQWASQREGVFELAGKTLLLVGVGAIGRRTAQLCHSLGMRVLGIRRNPDRTAPGIDEMGGMDRLRERLPDADFVVLTVPLTAETRHMMSTAEFAAMQRSAYLINIGRGGTVDEAALVAALQEGRIAGAGLDVTEIEPLPADSPLWQMENVILTAHYSGVTPAYHLRAMAIFLDNLRRYVNDEPLRNVVDKKLGY